MLQRCLAVTLLILAGCGPITQATPTPGTSPTQTPTASPAESSPSPTAETPAPSAIPTDSPTPTAPQLPSATPSDETIEMAFRSFHAPFRNRVDSSAVWTGSELIVWGGWEWVRDGLENLRANGLAYDPIDDSWREISRGPLSARCCASSTWLNSEMIIWGGAEPPPQYQDAAAYDPSANEWRTVAQSPLEWGGEMSTATTDTEWWISQRTREGQISVAAYDPLLDTWRSLPEVPGTGEGGVWMAWTGSEVVLTTGAELYRIAPDATHWSQHSVQLHGPLHVAEGLVFGFTDEETWTGSGVTRYLRAWDPSTGAEVDLPRPPTDVWDAIAAGSHLMFLRERLAFDAESLAWAMLDTPEDVTRRRASAATVWTGDRVLIWGGWWACPGYSEFYENGYELVPDLDVTAGGSDNHLARRAGVRQVEQQSHFARQSSEEPRTDAPLNLLAC